MGIFGLTGFIDRNSHLLHKHELRNCSVIIDGNNFYHHVYRAAHIESVFGGDYDVYRQKLRINLKSLLKCGIVPYIVLDGGYTTDGRKLKKCVERAKKRIRNVDLASRKGFCQMTPLLAHDTFLQTLDEMKIHHVTCQFEADNEIAKLANRLQCPVISNDSDFFIFDLSHGFLPLDYIEFNPLFKKSPDSAKLQPFLHCHLYQVDDLINSFEGLNRSVLPIFASLLGNDFVAPNVVERVFSRMQVPKSVSRRFKLPSKLSKIVKLLHWLEVRSDGSTNILDKILPYIQSKKQFMSSVEGYFKINDFEGSDLFQYFNLNDKEFQPLAASTFAGYNSASFPTWFLTAVCKGELSPSIINAAVLHRVIFLSQVEKLKFPTTHDCSRFVRLVICGILAVSDPPQHRNLKYEDSNLNVKTKDFFSEFLAAVEKNSSASNDICDDKNLLLCEKGDLTTNDSTDDLNKACDRTLRSSSSVLDCEKQMDDDKIMGKVVVESDEDDQEKVISDHETVDEMMDVNEDLSENFLSLKERQFEEYHRQGKRVKKIFLQPSLSIRGEKLPTIDDIGSLLHKKRLQLLIDSLETNLGFIDLFSYDVSLFMVCVTAWIQHANPQITEHHLDCTILCLILLNMQSSLGILGKSRNDKKFAAATTYSDDTCDKESSGIEQNEKGDEVDSFIDLQQICNEEKSSKKFISAICNLERYQRVKPDFSRRTITFESEVVHIYSQLQCCMFEISNLNKLLRFPLPNIKPAMVFNGSFLYNFYIDLISRPKPNEFIEAMLFKTSRMHSVFLKMKSIIMNTVSLECFATLGQDLKKRKKKNKGKRKRKNSASGSEKVLVKEEEKEVSRGEESAEELIAIEGFNVRNKFSLLSL